MKRLVFGLIAAGAVGIGVPSTASAHDQNHARYHDELEHRAYHRELDHREAHRYPMTWRQHGRLHDELEHDAYHDRLEHRAYHRYYSPHHGHHRHGHRGSRQRYGYGPYYGSRGFGISGRGFSLWFGH